MSFRLEKIYIQIWIPGFPEKTGRSGTQPGFAHLVLSSDGNAPSRWAQVPRLPIIFGLGDFAHSRVSATTVLQGLARGRWPHKYQRIAKQLSTEIRLILEETDDLMKCFVHKGIGGQGRS